MAATTKRPGHLSKGAGGGGCDDSVQATRQVRRTTFHRHRESLLRTLPRKAIGDEGSVIDRAGTLAIPPSIRSTHVGLATKLAVALASNKKALLNIRNIGRWRTRFFLLQPRYALIQLAALTLRVGR
jgi:hypothetical protein